MSSRHEREWYSSGTGTALAEVALWRKVRSQESNKQPSDCPAVAEAAAAEGPAPGSGWAASAGSATAEAAAAKGPASGSG